MWKFGCQVRRKQKILFFWFDIACNVHCGFECEGAFFLRLARANIAGIGPGSPKYQQLSTTEMHVVEPQGTLRTTRVKSWLNIGYTSSPANRRRAHICVPAVDQPRNSFGGSTSNALVGILSSKSDISDSAAGVKSLPVIYPRFCFRNKLKGESV